MTLWTFGVWKHVWEDFRARTLFAGRPSGPASRTAPSVQPSHQLFDSYNPANVHAHKNPYVLEELAMLIARFLVGVCTRHGLRRIEMLRDDKYEVSAE